MNNIIEYFKKSNSYQATSTDGLNIFNSLTDFYIDNNIYPKYPMFLSLLITSNCNGHCLFCSCDSKRPQFEEDSVNPILYKRLKELSYECSPLVISLCGGEPMLYPNRCVKYLEIFKETKTIFSILSNLSLDLNRERLHLINILEQQPFSFIQTSIDSMNESEHRILRKGTELSKILSNIKLLQKKNIKIKVNTTVSQYNYKSIMDVVRYVYNEGIESLHINHVLPFGRAKGITDDKFFIDIIHSLLEVASSKEFNGIKEHSITFPSESIPISFIGSKYEDILKVYDNGNKNKYLSSQFIFNLSHEDNYSGVGWISDMDVSLVDKKIIEAYNIFRSKSHRYYNDMCKRCLQYNNCNSESFYTGSCLMIDLYNKINDILKYKAEPTCEEFMRLRILNELENRSKSIYEVILCMTKECNGNCNFCQVEGLHKDTKLRFDIKEIVRFLKGNCYSVQITGGEPLFRLREVEYLIKELKKDGHIISLLTNGVLIDDSFIKTLKSSFSILDVIQISIYAHNPELHNIICGRDDWDKLNDILACLVNNGIQVRANLTLTNDNVEFVDKIYYHYKSIGINQIAINSLLKKGKAYDMVDEKYIYRYIYYIHKFITENNPQGLSLSIPVEVIKTYSNIKNNFGDSINNKNLSFTEKNRSAYIDYNGSVYSHITGELITHVSDNVLSKVEFPDICRNLLNSECKSCHGFSICKGRTIFDQTISKYGNLNYSYCDL